MTWATIHVFAYQEVPTAANLNNNFANLNETSPGKVTTKADMTAATGANAIARVAGGSVRYWGPVTNSAEATGIKFYPQPVVLENSYSTSTVASTASETDTWSYSLAAGALGAKERMVIKFNGEYLNNTGSGRTVNFKFYVGGTARSVTLTMSASASLYYFEFEVIIIALGATNSQQVFFNILYGAYGVVGINWVPSTFAGTDDFSAAKTLKFAVTHAISNASLTMKVWHPLINVYAGLT